jgi:hypothetical protein
MELDRDGVAHDLEAAAWHDRRKRFAARAARSRTPAPVLLID